MKLAYLIFFVSLTCLFCKNKKDLTDVASLDKDLSDLINDYVADEGIAGMGLLYYSDKYGELSFATGLSDVESNIPMDTSAIYDIGSVTKMFISVLTLQLIDEGKITFDSDIQNWININSSDSTITIGQLLNHTSGIGEYLSNSSFLDKYYTDNDTNFKLDDIINAGLIDSANGQQGVWHYSNTNYLILAKIIEAVTNNSVEKELEKVILGKTGMINTYYMPEKKVEHIDKLATGYQFGNKMDADKNYFLYNAAGGMVSTLNDMKKFAEWLKSSGFLEKMTSNSIDCVIEHGFETKYGNGIIIAEDVFDTKMFGHGGTSFGFKSEFWFSKETGEIIIYFANDYMYNKNYRGFRRKLNEILQKYR